jgi:hypothetical protein
MPRHPLAARALPLLTLMLLTGCATGGFGSGLHAKHRSAQVTVRNDHWEDLTIYLDRDGNLFRLGVVDGNTSRTLAIPNSYLTTGSSMCFVATIAGRQVHARSAPFGLAPGANARWMISLSQLESPVVLDASG